MTTRKRRSQVEQEVFPLRQKIEQSICAVNKFLKKAVKSMSIPILLNNCPPSDRQYYASLLFEEGYITREQANSFNDKKYLHYD